MVARKNLEIVDRQLLTTTWISLYITFVMAWCPIWSCNKLLYLLNIIYRRKHCLKEDTPRWVFASFFTIVTNSLSVVTRKYTECLFSPSNCLRTRNWCSLRWVLLYPLRCIMTWLTSFSWASYSRLSNLGSLVALVMGEICLVWGIPLALELVPNIHPNSLVWG